MGRRINISEARVKQLYRCYERRARAGKRDVIDGLAARQGIYPSTLLRLFRRNGLATLNVKPKQREYTRREIRRWHKEYREGAIIDTLAAKHRLSTKTISLKFRELGLKVRTAQEYLGLPKLTARQIDALVRKAGRVHVPARLKREWRGWPMERRRDFILRIRAKLNSPKDQATTPFSANVERFDYWSENARTIVQRMNAGRNSRNKVIALKPGSQGVIWTPAGGEPQIFFWVSNLPKSAGGIYQKGAGGTYRTAADRPLLHHLIWKEHHEREIPAGHVIRFRDGNVNNLDPENLDLQWRGDEAMENSAKHPGKRADLARAALRARWDKHFQRQTNDERAELQRALKAP
jgi:hypothetical protein